MLSFYKKHAPSNSRDKAVEKALKRSESRGDSKSKSRNQSFFNSQSLKKISYNKSTGGTKGTAPRQQA